MPSVVILGGGLSGLAAAFRIREALPQASFTVLEAAATPGGQVVTTDRGGFRVEGGPNGVFDAKPDGVALCRDLGLSGQLIAGSEASRKNRYLYVDDSLHTLPGSPFGILTTPTLSLRGRLALLAEPLRRRRTSFEDESIADFARRRFGREAAETFVDGLVTGIYAGDPERLSVRACFPRLVEYEREAGSVLRGILRARKRKKQEAAGKGEPRPGPQRLWSFTGGLRVLIDALASQLGPSLVCGFAVKRLERTATGWLVSGEGAETWPADAVVLTLPAYRQAELLADHDGDLANDLAGIAYNRIAVVALGYRSDQVTGPQNGFGYIAPQRQGRDVLGVQWCSSVFPDRAPAGFVLWRALVGGVKRADAADWPDGELLRAVHNEVKHTTGVKGEPVFSEIVRWPKAIPQYERGHLDRVARIDAAATALPGLFLGGNAFRGVSLADCAGQGRVLAGAVRQFLSNPLPTA